MADLCAHCTLADAAPTDEPARRNDFVGWLGNGTGYGQVAWGLCAGCGCHLIDNEGRRACGTDAPQAEHPCGSCLAIAGERQFGQAGRAAGLVG